MLWLTAFIHRFSYNSAAASFFGSLLPSSLPPCSRFSSSILTYFILSRSSGEPRFGKGSPTMTTARARSSAKFNPSESFAPMTANSRAPPFLSGSRPYEHQIVSYYAHSIMKRTMNHLPVLLPHTRGVPCPHQCFLVAQKTPKNVPINNE